MLAGAERGPVLPDERSDEPVDLVQLSDAT